MTLLKTPIRWLGGKSTLASQIVSRMPKHDLYLEPFAGGLGVLYAKSRSEYEIINDLHSDLVNLYRVIRNQKAELLESLELMPYAREEFLRGVSPDPALPAIERAALFFLYLRASHGSGGGRRYRSGFASPDPGSSSCRHKQWLNLLPQLPALFERLKGVTIENRDALDLIGKYGKRANALIYADPPYVEVGEKYKHDFSEEDHRALAQALNRCKAKVMLSYYEHPLIRELYAGWTIERLSRTSTMKKHTGSVPEILISNFNPQPSLWEAIGV